MKFSRIKIILFFQYPLLIDWVSEWLLFNANSLIFQLYYGENKLIINKMMMRSALFWTKTLSWIFIVIAQWNNCPRIEMSLHSDTLFWFRANQSLLFLRNAALLSVEAPNTNVIVLGLTRPGLEPMIYRTRGEHANHYTTDAVLLVNVTTWIYFVTVW